MFDSHGVSSVIAEPCQSFSTQMRYNLNHLQPSFYCFFCLKVEVNTSKGNTLLFIVVCCFLGNHDDQVRDVQVGVRQNSCMKSADSAGEDLSCPWLCCEVSSQVAECHLVFQGILLYGCCFPGQRRLSGGTSSHYPDFSRTKDSARGKTDFSLTNWFIDSLKWSVLSLFFQRECFILYKMHFILFICIMFILSYRRFKNVGPHAWTYC